MQLTVVPESKIDASTDEAIRRLQLRAFPDTDQFRISRYYIHRPQPDDVYVLAWQDDQLIGQVVVYWAALPQGRMACLGNVCSDPDARGSGCASAAVELAIDAGRDRGVDWITLFCKSHLVPFYERLGFVVVDHDIWITRPDGTTAARHHEDLCMVLALGNAAWPTEKLQLDIDDF